MNTPDQQCVFCDIWRGEAEAEFVKRWARVFAIVPLNPVTPGHVLVIPGFHISDFTTDPYSTGYVMRHASQYASELGGEYNLITSKGKDATQTVFHMHVHLVPRRSDDGLKLPWSDQ